MSRTEFTLSLQLLVATVWLVGALRTLASNSGSGVPVGPAARVVAAIEAVAAMLFLGGWQTPWLAAAFTVRQLYTLGRGLAQRWVPSRDSVRFSAGFCHELALAAGGILLATTPTVAGQTALPRSLDQVSAQLPVVLTLSGVLALAYLVDHIAFARHKLRAGWNFDAHS